ncbi:3-oxo-5-alpha-steroid 4-dehydrogenase domain-containing protein [Trichoderma austrokoningii]
MASTTPAEWCQAFCVVSSAMLFSMQVLPENARRALFAYGARRPAHTQHGPNSQAPGRETEAKADSLLVLTSYAQVPHSWFIHFYMVSVSWSIFWGWQYISKGSIMRALAEMQHQSAIENQAPEVDLSATLVTWLLMGSQGTRRLFECLFVAKPGSSPMSALHWALGVVYYTIVGISVWIRGSGAILKSWDSPQPIHLTPQIIIGAAIFGFASSQQNNCHRYLASLKKYTLPSEGWFQYLACPHYTFECLVYLGLAVAAAPPGAFINRSILYVLLFVVTNLGWTAYGTKKWYADKFGADKLVGKWAMIPFVF